MSDATSKDYAAGMTKYDAREQAHDKAKLATQMLDSKHCYDDDIRIAAAAVLLSYLKDDDE